MLKKYVVPCAQRGSIVAEAEIEALTTLLGGASPLSLGTWRDRFEEEFRTLVGTRHAISVTSGTVALQLAVHVLDLEPGDEVVVTPQTYQATVQPLLDQPVTVRFCDVDPATLNIDPAAFEASITERTKALLLVHYGGSAAEMDTIMRIARAHGVVVVEDCAHTLGGTYRGRPPGGLADIGCFSFQNSKNITTLGEGGMITCNDDRWARRLDRLRNNDYDGSVSVSGTPDPDEPLLLPWMKYSAGVYRDTVHDIRRGGTNATLSEAASAVGVVQLHRLPELNALRRSVAARIDEVLAAHPFVTPQAVGPGNTHAYHLYTCFAPDSRLRDELVLALDRNGIEIQLRYFPQHLLPEWRHRGHRRGQCPVAEDRWFSAQINLPCHPGLSDSQVGFMADALDTALSELNGPAAGPVMAGAVPAVGA